MSLAQKKVKTTVWNGCPGRTRGRHTAHSLPISTARGRPLPPSSAHSNSAGGSSLRLCPRSPPPLMTLVTHGSSQTTPQLPTPPNRAPFPFSMQMTAASTLAYSSSAGSSTKQMPLRALRSLCKVERRLLRISISMASSWMRSLEMCRRPRQLQHIFRRLVPPRDGQRAHRVYGSLRAQPACGGALPS